MDVWYLSHPVQSDDRYTLKQNLRHILEYTEFFWKHNITVCATYYSQVLAIPDKKPEAREKALQGDEEVIRRLGKGIFVGHRMSTGMRREFNALLPAVRDYSNDYKDPHKVQILVGSNRQQIERFIGEGLFEMKGKFL